MIVREYTPHPFAPLAMEHLTRQPRSALWAKPGVGKTVLSLTYLDILHRVAGEDAPTLVLAPLRVARDGWAIEAGKWRHLQGLDVVPITGTFEEREAALRRDAPVYTINYENLVWLAEWLEHKGRAWPFRTVIADEATKLKGFRVQQGTVRTQVLGRVAHKQVRRWVNLTGTPAPNGLKDLWGQTWFLDAGQRLGRTYSAFEERWFGYKRIKDAISKKPGVVPIIMPGADEQIHEKLRDICLSLDPKDWFDLREPIVNVVEVELPASARKTYRALERELFAELGEFEVEVFNAAALTNKCLQLANGAVYLDPNRYAPVDGEPQAIEVHFEKLDALAELMDETGDDPLLVCYQFRSDLARIRRQFPEALVLSEQRDLERAKRGEGKLWLAHPASLGHGVDGLQEHWNLENHDQVLERVGPMRQLQAGKDRPVFLHYIVARKTLDEAVMARRAGKRSVQDTLMAYMRGET
jgi:SNF2 family DNA or RNA helicase